MHGMFSFPARPFFATILHEINSLPDVPGVGIDALLPREPFYLGRYVLSSTIRGDIRVLPAALVAHPMWVGVITPVHAPNGLGFQGINLDSNGQKSNKKATLLGDLWTILDFFGL